MSSYEELLEKGILISPDLDGADLKKAAALSPSPNLLILNKDALELVSGGKNINPDWLEFERALFFKQKKSSSGLYLKFLDYFKEAPEEEAPELSDVKKIFSYEEKSTKRTANDFVAYFNQRFKAVEQMLRGRQELQGLTSINRLHSKKERESASIICMVSEKSITKNQNIILSVEDQTGTVKVLINKNREDICSEAKDIVLDEIIGISGVMGKGMLFANSLVFPDVPLDRELKKSKQEIYAVFLGDPHYGNKFFLEKEFQRFISWIKGESGSEEQRRIASKTKYLFVLGDLVEGVGIYPGQEEDLAVIDAREQYAGLARFFEQIPKNINIIIIPGNHDAGRMSEPQPPLYDEFLGPMLKLPNATFLSNPSMVNIESNEDFPGFDILLYHGYSLIYYADNVESIRQKGGQKRADLIMQFLLKRRHLAPTHTSNMYIPDPKKDPLVIEKVPDIFATGHIHRVAVKNYRGVTMLNCSAWTGITENQEKRGLEPQPARVVIVNLQTREAKIMNFGRKEEK